MSERFVSIRQALRAVLIASLVTFGHALLKTIASAPITLQSVDLADSTNAISLLLFSSILWVALTAIESTTTASIGFDANEEDEPVVFLGRTWVELLGNSVLLGCWTIYHASDISTIRKALPTSIAPQLTLIPATYYMIVTAFSALLVQLLVTAALHAWRGGRVWDRAFWNSKTGNWKGNVRLESVEEKIGL